MRDVKFCVVVMGAGLAFCAVMAAATRDTSSPGASAAHGAFVQASAKSAPDAPRPKKGI